MRLIATVAVSALFAVIAVAANPVTASAVEVIWGT